MVASIHKEHISGNKRWRGSIVLEKDETGHIITFEQLEDICKAASVCLPNLNGRIMSEASWYKCMVLGNKYRVNFSSDEASANLFMEGVSDAVKSLDP